MDVRVRVWLDFVGSDLDDGLATDCAGWDRFEEGHHVSSLVEGGMSAGGAPGAVHLLQRLLAEGWAWTPEQLTFPL